MQIFERYSVTLKLTFSNGETIETTKEHPFYVAGKGFVPAGEMGIGTSIVTRAGPGVHLVASVVGEAQKVFNFEVEDFHTYFVGCLGAWVHNACSTKLDKALGGSPLDKLQAHHLIPAAHEGHAFVLRAKRVNWNIDGAPNGLHLPDNDADSILLSIPRHSGAHPNYSIVVGTELDQLEAAAVANQWNDAQCAVELTALAARMRQHIRGLGGGVRLN